MFPTIQYQKISPPSDLRHYIEYIWTFTADIGPEIHQQVLTPTGHPSLIFCLGEPGIRVDTLTGKRYDNANIYCTVATRPFLIEQRGNARYVGIELKPYGLAAFTNSRHSTNHVGSLRDIFNLTALDQLLISITHPDFPPSAIEHILSFLRTRVDFTIYRDMVRIANCITLVQTLNGAVRVKDLADAIHVSPSTLRRYFHRWITIGPEQFINITRYNSFIQSRLEDPDKPLSLTASLHGYYDEAHAVKEFKKYTGLNKKGFFNKSDRITRMIHDK